MIYTYYNVYKINWIKNGGYTFNIYDTTIISRILNSRPLTYDQKINICLIYYFRKMVAGGFNFTIIKSFIPIFYEEANVLNEILQKQRDLKSSECNISIPVSMATMEMIGKTALGVKFNAQNGGRHRFVENLQTAMHVGNIIKKMYRYIYTLIYFEKIITYFRHGNIELHIHGT